MLRKLVVFALIGLMLTLYFVFDLGQYLNLQTLKAQQASIEAYRARNPGLAAAIYFTLYVLITALSLPGAALLTVAGVLMLSTSSKLLGGLNDSSCLERRRSGSPPQSSAGSGRCVRIKQPIVLAATN